MATKRGTTRGIEDTWKDPARRGVGRRWRARWTDPHTHRQVSSSFTYREDAERHLRAIRVAIDTGTYRSASALTVAGYWDRWVPRQGWKQSTLAQQQSRWRVHVEPSLGSMRIEDVRQDHVQRIIDDMIGSGLAPATRVAVLALVRALLTAAVADQLIATSPAVPSIRVRRRRTPIRHVMTDAEVRSIVQALPQSYRLFARLIAATGLRSTEGRSLVPANVSLSPPTVTVDHQLVGSATSPGSVIDLSGEPKGGQAGYRVLAIPARLARELRSSAGPHFVFESSQHPGYPLNPRSASQAWASARDRVGLRAEFKGWHSLRHYHASKLISGGISVVAVARRLGHANSTTTLSHYAHLWPSDEASIMGVWETADPFADRDLP